VDLLYHTPNGSARKIPLPLQQKNKGEICRKQTEIFEKSLLTGMEHDE